MCIRDRYTAENIKTLRYGHLMIMTDQDHDGSHIKGLLINCLHHFWPSLLEIPGFLRCFITPIVKATSNSKKGPSKTFFTVSSRRPSTRLAHRVDSARVTPSTRHMYNAGPRVRGLEGRHRFQRVEV